MNDPPVVRTSGIGEAEGLLFLAEGESIPLAAATSSSSGAQEGDTRYAWGAGYELWRFTEPRLVAAGATMIGPGQLEWATRLYNTAIPTCTCFWCPLTVQLLTRQVADIYTGYHSSHPKYLKEHNKVLYFQANDGVHGSELWSSSVESIEQTDGNESTDGRTTKPIPSMFYDLVPGPAGGSPSDLEVHGGFLYFAADGNMLITHTASHSLLWVFGHLLICNACCFRCE